ncbi:MAG TPA: methyltransferase, partial [Myxococcota bacterium]|nr:methyltransferase [Myxococcota bacterium]
ELFYPARAGLLPAVQQGHSAFEATFGTDFFSWISGRPELRRAFDAGMGRQTEALAQRLAALLGEEERIVDLGGGQGTLLRAVLGQRPGCTGILLDRPAALAGAHRLLEEAGLQERCRIQEGSFFEDLPQGASSYVLSWILHDWSDDDCLRILRQVRKVLQPEARLLILEAVLPERVTAPSPVLESDLAMLVLLGGQERSEAEFAALLQAAGLRLSRRVDLGLDRCVLEARIAEDGGAQAAAAPAAG